MTIEITVSKRTRIYPLVLFFYLAIGFFNIVHAQEGRLEGLIYEGVEKEPVLFATVFIVNTSTGTTSDIDGNYLMELAPGTYQILYSSIGYEEKLVDNIIIKAEETTRLDIELGVSTELLEEVIVIVSPLSRKEKSPLSLRTLRANEIQFGAGSSGDISLLLQSLPGVGSTASFSNALIVRGGSSIENRFFVDDIEIPILNHFAKQGTTGGFRSLLNMDLIDRVNLYSSAFPIDKGNALSGIVDFKLKEGDKEGWTGSIVLSSADVGLTFSGPLSQSVNIIGSLRRAYTKPVSKLLKRPHLVTYDDWNYKLKWNIAENHKLTFIGLGGSDSNIFNKYPRNTLLNQFFEDISRPSSQNNLVNGLKYTNFRGQHFSHLILSHYYIKDQARRFKDTSNPNNPTEAYDSKETELRLTIKNTQRYNDLKFSFGGEISRISHQTTALFSIVQEENLLPNHYQSDLSFYKYGAYAQVSQRLFQRFMLLSLGMRITGNSFSSAMNNPFRQFSPRLSISYALNQQTTINFNTGRFYQLPTTLLLSFRSPAGELANQSDQVKYRNVTHWVAGVEWEKFDIDTKINIEAFYKKYNNYPVSVQDQVALVNKEINLSRILSEAITSTGTGRVYGIEFLLELKNWNDFYGKLTYTLARNEFKDHQQKYQPSIYDVRHTINLQGGKHFKNDWHVGGRVNWASAQPYTPYDFEKSSLISSWSGAQPFNVPDYQQLNTGRTASYVNLNIRVDKTIKFKQWDLTLFIDILNVLDARPALQPYVAIKKDANKVPLINKENPLAYQTFWLPNKVSTFFPSIGIKASI